MFCSGPLSFWWIATSCLVHFLFLQLVNTVANAFVCVLGRSARTSAEQFLSAERRTLQCCWYVTMNCQCETEFSLLLQCFIVDV